MLQVHVCLTTVLATSSSVSSPTTPCGPRWVELWLTKPWCVFIALRVVWGLNIFIPSTVSTNLFSCVWLFVTTWPVVHGILQARILEWVAVPFSRGSSQPRDRTQVSHIAGGFFTSWATREAITKEPLVESERVPGASTRSPACGKGHEVKGTDRQRRVRP